MAGEGPVEEGEGPSGGRFGGPRTQLKRRMALAQYMLHQVRCSRQAYYPETGKKGGPQEGSPGGSQGDGTGDSAADIAAAGAEGLADALDPSVPVSALLSTIPTSPSAAADAGGTSPHLTAAGEVEALRAPISCAMRP
ncbi:hypothetical protein EPH_0016820 [Eimeria praecox]|uniref:Uncharacterized protein n=1 Tax=Eimeria praecox TaxID=51316 RepID=U6H2P0_9EIME|nr:hypothetical protein EPH_0016820 [Eimeria praecox]